MSLLPDQTFAAPGVAFFSGGGGPVGPDLTLTGNLAVGGTTNLTGVVTALANVGVGGTLTTNALISTTTVTASSMAAVGGVTAATVAATGSITAGTNIFAAGVSATGQVAAAGAVTAASVDATGAITAGSVSATGGLSGATLALATINTPVDPVPATSTQTVNIAIGALRIQAGVAYAVLGPAGTNIVYATPFTTVPAAWACVTSDSAAIQAVTNGGTSGAESSLSVIVSALLPGSLPVPTYWLAIGAV